MELYSAIVAVETFDFHPFARFEYQHIRYEIVEQSRNKQGGKITIDNVPAEYLLENDWADLDCLIDPSKSACQNSLLLIKNVSPTDHQTEKK